LQNSKFRKISYLSPKGKATSVVTVGRRVVYQ